MPDLPPFRARNMATLRDAGFRCAPRLPFYQEAALRPRHEIVRRLGALQAVIAHVCAPEDQVPTPDITSMVADHELDAWLNQDEAAMLAKPRALARALHIHAIGWRMEYLVPLAWALGHDLAPRIDGQMIDGDELHAVIDFGPIDTTQCRVMLEGETLRAEDEIVAMEDLFFCVHNAVRHAQFYEPSSVPDDFDPLTNGGVIHERRHALTWLLSPGVDWDDTELGT